MIYSTMLRRVVPAAIVLAAVAVFPYLYRLPLFDQVLDPFRTFQATRLAIWLIILLGLNLLTGYTGQISLGHGALVAIGAYAAAILMDEFGVPVAVAVLAAGLLTGAFGFVLGAPALRFSGPYLAIATLAMMLALPQVLKLHGINEWTGGAQGILLSAPRAPEVVDGFVTDRQWIYFCCVVPAIAMTTLAWNITHGPVGRAFVALRDSEVAAQQMGVNVALYKMLAFGLSAFYAGVGGGLFVFTEAFMSPDTFDVNLSITMLVMVVLGGLASTSGVVVAAVIMTFRNDIVDALASAGVLDLPGALVPGKEQSPDTLRGALYGIALIFTVIFMPRGVAGTVTTVLPERIRAFREGPGERWTEIEPRGARTA
jgi:branched-chain amino acid transport system permease protein